MRACVPPLRFFVRICRSAYCHLPAPRRNQNQTTSSGPSPTPILSHAFLRNTPRATPVKPSPNPYLPPLPPPQLSKLSDQYNPHPTVIPSFLRALRTHPIAQHTPVQRIRRNSQASPPNPNDHVCATFSRSREKREREAERGREGGEEQDSREGEEEKRREFTRPRASAFGDGGAWVDGDLGVC